MDGTDLVRGPWGGNCVGGALKWPRACPLGAGPLEGAGDLGGRVGAGTWAWLQGQSSNGRSLWRAGFALGAAQGRGLHLAAWPRGWLHLSTLSMFSRAPADRGLLLLPPLLPLPQVGRGCSAPAPQGGSALGAPWPGLTRVPAGGAGFRGRQLRPLGPVSRGRGSGEEARRVGRREGAGVGGTRDPPAGRPGRNGGPGLSPPAPGAAIPQVPAPGPLEQPVARGVSGGHGAQLGATVLPWASPTRPPPTWLHG